MDDWYFGGGKGLGHIHAMGMDGWMDGWMDVRMSHCPTYHSITTLKI